MATNVILAYCLPVASLGAEHFGHACRFAACLHAFPPLAKHELVIISNGGPPDLSTEALFAPFDARFIEHDDSGWDIGAYIAASKQVTCDMLVCFGGTSYFKRKGWLSRLVWAWERYGPGFYGTLSSFEIRPHLNTTGFACMPELLSTYPAKVLTKADRYEFEHGRNSLHLRAQRMNLPVKLVTWDGVWDMRHWRVPDNIYRRGDQSNCLTYFHATENYELQPWEGKLAQAAKTNVWERDEHSPSIFAGG